MKSLIGSLVLSMLVVSQARAEQALDQLLACRRVPDPAARLECFDRASDAASMAKQRAAGPSPSNPSIVESSILRISQPATGRADFVLENGQVWRQMDAETARSAKTGDRVVVSKSLLGAYWLKIEGGHAWRVTLIR